MCVRIEYWQCHIVTFHWLIVHGWITERKNTDLHLYAFTSTISTNRIVIEDGSVKRTERCLGFRSGCVHGTT